MNRNNWKDFRKVPDEEKLEKFGGLLKLYQQEIDVLSKRSTFAENQLKSIAQQLHFDRDVEIIGPQNALQEATVSTTPKEIVLELLLSLLFADIITYDYYAA